MRWTWELMVEKAVGAFKYALSVLLMLSGVLTVAFGHIDTTADAHVQWLYGSHLGLIIAGIVVFIAGAALFYGKIKRNRKWTGRGLFWCYCCLLFGTIAQGIAYAWAPGAWISNAVFCAITGILWLRWKFKTSYVDPKHFRDDVISYRHERV